MRKRNRKRAPLLGYKHEPVIIPPHGERLVHPEPEEPVAPVETVVEMVEGDILSVEPENRAAAPSAPPQPNPPPEEHRTPVVPQETPRSKRSWVYPVAVAGLVVVALIVFVVCFVVAIRSDKQTAAEESAVKTTSRAPQLVFTEDVESEAFLLEKGKVVWFSGKAGHCVRWPQLAPIQIQIQKDATGVTDPITTAQFGDGKYQSAVFGISIDPERWKGDMLVVKVRHVPWGHPDAKGCHP